MRSLRNIYVHEGRSLDRAARRFAPTSVSPVRCFCGLLGSTRIHFEAALAVNAEPRTPNNRQLRKETGRRMLQYASFAEVKQRLVSIKMVRSGRNGLDRACIDGKTVFNGNHLRSSSVREVTFRERGGRKGMPHGDSTVARVQKSRWYFSTT